MKRLYIPVAALALMAGGAYAQSTTPAAPATGSPAPQATQPATPPPAAPSTEAQPTTPSTRTSHKRMTLKERFDAANTTHDGHLTKAQAEASGGFKLLTRHWSEFDKTGKGYVTMADIHAYYRQRRAARRASHGTTSGSAPSGSMAPAQTTPPAGSTGQSE